MKSDKLLTNCFKTGNKVFLCGNGGSAADSQHIAAEFIGRFRKERKSLPAIALTVDSSALTAIGNDWSFDYVFARQLEGLGKKDDVAFFLSTSGNSPNILKAAETAKSIGIVNVGLGGNDGGKMKSLMDHCFVVPSLDTAIIQEHHIMIAHLICRTVDELL